MTLKEAYKILVVSKENSDREIKAKYKKLLIMYHPDSDPTRKRDPEDDEKIRQVIEAYNKIRESEGELFLNLTSLHGMPLRTKELSQSGTSSSSSRSTTKPCRHPRWPKADLSGILTWRSFHYLQRVFLRPARK
ncbi:DnaJ domain-containing protein [Butyrivibrio sp. AE2032]|uniref:DnaJ domain-containing protein n=1 Tax=Butyrivibrio sp. AE2032 TaxID=1458463 RepID=UPI00055489EC|nr:DnaJ domain-containing protein [Butyrivibrio sp. AE2032]